MTITAGNTWKDNANKQQFVNCCFHHIQQEKNNRRKGKSGINKNKMALLGCNANLLYDYKVKKSWRCGACYGCDRPLKGRADRSKRGRSIKGGYGYYTAI